MRVTAIKQQVKNLERASIFVDGKYSFSLSLNDLVAEKLKVGLEIDDSTLAALKKKSADGKLKMRSLEWVLSRPHSIREFKDYLKRKKAEPDFIEKLVEEFLKRSYLDDQKFAVWWRDRSVLKQKSNRAIEFELRGKGVDREVIAEVVGGEEISEKDRLIASVQKLQNKTRYQDSKKLTAYLVGRGYSYSLVKEVLSDG